MHGEQSSNRARLDAVLPEGKAVKAEIADGLFAFVTDGTDPSIDIVLHAYDKAGDLIYESEPSYRS